MTGRNLNRKKAFFEKAAEFLNAKYGAGTVTAVVKDSYYNMKEKIEPHMELIHIAENAMRKNGVTPVISPVRAEQTAPDCLHGTSMPKPLHRWT